MVVMWITEFRCGHTRTSDDKRFVFIIHVAIKETIPRYSVGGLEIVSARDCVSHRHIKCFNYFDVE